MLDVNSGQIERIQRQLREHSSEMPNVIARAVNRTASHVRTVASRETRKTYNVKHGDISKTFSLRRANKNNLRAKLVSKGFNIPLTQFPFQLGAPDAKRRRSVSVSVKKQGGGVIKSAFMHRKVGVPQIFKREGKERYPIRTLVGPAIPTMLDNPTTKEIAAEKAAIMLDKRINHEINHVLRTNGG